MDPNGQKPVRSNILLGLAAHWYIEGNFINELSLPGIKMQNVWNPYGVADIVYNDGINQVAEIKPSSYLSNLKGDLQLQREIAGMEIRYPLADACPLDSAISSEYFNYTMPVPGMEDWTLSVFTNLEHPGMIYYQYDDGELEGTPQPSFADSLSIYGAYLDQKFQSFQETFDLDSLSPVLEPVPGLVY